MRGRHPPGCRCIFRGAVVPIRFTYCDAHSAGPCVSPQGSSHSREMDVCVRKDVPQAVSQTPRFVVSGRVWYRYPLRSSEAFRPKDAGSRQGLGRPPIAQARPAPQATEPANMPGHDRLGHCSAPPQPCPNQLHKKPRLKRSSVATIPRRVYRVAFRAIKCYTPVARLVAKWVPPTFF